MDDLKDRVTRIEAVLPTLSTKEDIANLRAEMHREFVSSTRWTVGTMLVIASVALAAAKLLGI